METCKSHQVGVKWLEFDANGGPQRTVASDCCLENHNLYLNPNKLYLFMEVHKFYQVDTKWVRSDANRGSQRITTFDSSSPC